MSTYQCQNCALKWDDSSFFSGVKESGCRNCGSNIIDRIERPEVMNHQPASLPEDKQPRAVQNGMSQAEYDTWIFLADKPGGAEEYTYVIKQSDLTRFITARDNQRLELLLSQLPEKVDQDARSSDATAWGMDIGWNDAIDKYTAVLKQSLQPEQLDGGE